MLSAISPSPFTRRTSAERAVVVPSTRSPPSLQAVATRQPRVPMVDEADSPPHTLSPTFSSHSSTLPSVTTPPRAANQQRRTSSLFSLSLSSSSSSSSSSLPPVPVSRSLSFQLPSSSSSFSSQTSSHFLSSPATLFDAVSDCVPMPTEELEPVVLVTPPPLVSKKTASHLRMANRTQQQPVLVYPLQTPSKDEQKAERADESDKENAAPASAQRQHTPRSHKDLFAVKKALTHRQPVSGSRRRRAEDMQLEDVEWHSEERVSAMRRLRSIR